MNDAVPALGLPRRRVAVVGSGVAGLTAAYVLSRSCEVTLYEAAERLGGHADTHEVTVGDRTVGIDTGFIVHNERTYPVLLRLFAELGVETQDSDMSMSVRCDDTGLEYAGAQGASGLFPTARNLARPRYLRMLAEIPRFHRMARRLLAADLDTDEPLGAFLERGRFSAYFVTFFAEPLVAAVWSCDPDVALQYPARYLFSFLDHHGMLGIFGSPRWRTVTGGSRAYVDLVAKGVQDVRTGLGVSAVRETGDGVEVTDVTGARTDFDAVVVATHPRQALQMLTEPTAPQREVLAAMPYSTNIAQLHTDESLLPRQARARASWNYLRPHRGDRASGVVVTYDLTRLQRVTEITDRRFLVTLGGADRVDPDTVLDTMHYEHPLYTPSSVAAQRRLPEINTSRIAFAGAYHGWGFHEDGALSGLRAAEHLGGTWEAPPEPARAERLPSTPRIYRTSIRHARHAPLRNAFTYRSYAWLVDLDRLPRHRGPAGPLLRRLAAFEARDHLGSPERSLRENLDTFLAGQDVDLGGGRILMLANARVLGYVFNPISVYWCHDPDDTLVCVVVEVHNTYGDRHAYLVRPDESGRARVPKQMYVSPFNDTEGEYELIVPRPTTSLGIGVRLVKHDAPPFSASMRGEALPEGTASLVRSAVRSPLAPLVATFRIHWQGVRLWARGLPVQKRPHHPRQEHVQ